MVGKRARVDPGRAGLGARIEDIRSLFAWDRCPSVLWVCAGVLVAVAAVVALVMLPGEVQRTRALSGERICGEAAAPCLTQVSGTLALLVDNDEEFVLKGTPPQDYWTLTDAEGRTWEFGLWASSEQDLDDGGTGTLRVWRPEARGGGSATEVLVDGEWHVLDDAGWPMLNLWVVLLVGGGRLAVLVVRRLPRRLVALRAAEGRRRAWWGTGRLPRGVTPIDPDIYVWMTLPGAALIVSSIYSSWVFWTVVPAGLLLITLVRRAVARDKAAGWVDPCEETA